MNFPAPSPRLDQTIFAFGVTRTRNFSLCRGRDPSGRVVDRAAQQNCKLSRLFLLPFVVYLQGKNLKPQISRRHVVFVYIKACRLVFTLQRTATAKTSVNSLLILSIYSQSSSECVSLMNESLFKELRLASLILTLDFVRSGERRKIFVLVILLQ